MAAKPLWLVVVLASLHASPSSSSSSGLKTYCIYSEDKDCDENWTPFPGMASALSGYDLPKGNPWAGDAIEDPGLRKQVFNATFEDPDGDYVMESGISMRMYRMCDREFSNYGATNMRGYEQAASASSSTGFGFDLGIEAEESGGRHEGDLPPMVTVAWQKTKEYEHARQYIFRTRGAVVVSEAQCVTHKVDVSHFLTPGFHPAFIEVLRFLEKQNTTVRQERAFKRFVRDYGTHYISSAYLGAKIATTTFYSNYERLKFGKQRLFNCSREMAYRAFHLDVPGEAEAEKAKKKKSDESENESGQMQRCPDISLADQERIRKTEYSQRPAESDNELSDWPASLEKAKDKFSPIPLKFELTPMVNLFTRENLDERLNVSSSAILKWFLPLYLKYCKLFDYDCSVESGCGFDDTCTFDENCVRDRSAKGGYRCQETSWADVSNWPQLPESYNPVGTTEATNTIDRSDTDHPLAEPDSPNISWFFEKDVDGSGSLGASELWIRYTENNWYNQRFQTAIEQLIREADSNFDREIDMQEYIKLHQTHPWYAEQVTFLLMNTDSNGVLSRQELLEAAKISPDMHSLGFNPRQLENLVDGLLKIGDTDGDHKITFEEYVNMSRDVFVDNFAPDVFKRIMKNR